MLNKHNWPVVLAVTFYVCVALGSVYVAFDALTRPTRLPCGVAEISPDFDNKQRQQCRQLRGHKL